MDRINLLETLVIAAHEGSFSAAGARRGISQSAVSQQMRLLEEQLGQQLLHRGGRGVQPTRAGEMVLAHAQRILEAHALMLAEVESLEQTPSGSLRISVSQFLGRRVLGPLLVDLGRSYPELEIVLRLEDRLVDVVREGYDLALRSGELGQTEGYGRRIAALETVLIATPQYLRDNGQPETPGDLLHHKFIQHHESQFRGVMPLTRGGEMFEAPIRVGFTADDPDLIMTAVLKHAGYSRVPRLFVAEGLADGTFAQILPGYRPEEKRLYAVTPTRQQPGSRVDLVVTAFTRELARLESEALARSPAPVA
ncbi:LysR family transcriptional regulator [Pseudoruegeria sp. SHC-113]|uniref:LysR family transcriptional regulator n=1 Tax=Pseudoruegeria sp. SHC-113 TaxID=2855439 RepID=UPI0021BB40D1|nr:LysR family transcriptional regulator [Pseudoruegeria sp. SHC-113]MCT8160630.1 LysR family transcriptional regulator [Pseudoruegeria sp. SHC-113]